MNRFTVAFVAILTLGQALPGQEQNNSAAPGWLRDYKFAQADFTFVRINYDDERSPQRSRRSWAGARSARRGSWATDYPDADLALSEHLSDVTSLRVDPNGKVLRLTDDRLADYPFIYMSLDGCYRATRT